ncbi:hypothetical protein N7540_013249 [Penicillium herquei]|nr:hypothetical protein N7540_013249 [Penicillium herquei]
MAGPDDAQAGVPEYIINDRYEELGALLASRKDLLETPVDYELKENKETTTFRVTPLILAVGWKRTRIVELLLKIDANVKAEIPTIGGTALHIAARFGPAAIVSLLLAKGADKDLKDKNCWAPLHFAAKYGHVQITAYLLDAHANIGICDDSESTPFLRAASFGSWKVMQLLLAQGSRRQLEDRNKFSNPPLWVASLNNHLDTVKWLLDVEAPVDQLGESESTPLHRACMSGHVEIAKLLIKRGADMHKRNEHEKTPLLLCCLNSQLGTYTLLQGEGTALETDKSGNNTFHAVLQCKKPFGNGQGEIMNRLFGFGVDINEANFMGLTPLMRSCKDKKLKHTKQLLDLGADINYQSPMAQSTPFLEACCTMENKDIIELLLQQGADTTMTNRHRMNGLLFACLNKCVKNVRALISHHLDVIARDKAGMSGFLIAARDGSTEITLELLKTEAYFPIDPIQKKAFREKFDHIREEVLETLLSGFDKKLYESQESLQPIMNWAVVNGCLDLINRCIQENPDSLQWRRAGNSWLHIATQHGQHKIIEECLAKVDTWCEAIGGISALHIAVSNGDIESAKVLLGLTSTQTPRKPRLAKVRAIVKLNHDNESPLTLCISQRKEDLESLFWSELKSFGNFDPKFYENHAVEAGRILEVLAEWEKPGKEVLLGHLLRQWFPRPSDPSLDITNWTTLHCAVYYSQAVVVWWLLSKRGYVGLNILETAQTIVPKTPVGDLILNLLQHPPPALDIIANPAIQPPALPTEPAESERTLKLKASIFDVYCVSKRITTPHDTPSVRDLIYNRGPDSLIIAASHLDQFALENFKRNLKRAKSSESGTSTPIVLHAPVSPSTDDNDQVKACSLFQNALDSIRYGESRSRFERPTTVGAVMELMLGVATGFFMQKCVKVTQGMRKAPMEVFRESIREVADEETHTFGEFLNDLRGQTEKRKISRDQSSGASSIRETPQNPYHIISNETELLDKIRDIRDELHMLRSLAEDQEVVWKQAFETSELRNCFQYNHPCTPTEVKRSLDDMNLEAEKTHNSNSVGTTAIVSIPAIFFAWKVNLIRDWFRTQTPKEPTTVSAKAVGPPAQAQDQEGRSQNQSPGTEGLEKLPEAGLYQKLRQNYKKPTEELV